MGFVLGLQETVLSYVIIVIAFKGAFSLMFVFRNLTFQVEENEIPVDLTQKELKTKFENFTFSKEASRFFESNKGI